MSFTNFASTRHGIESNWIVMNPSQANASASFPLHFRFTKQTKQLQLNYNFFLQANLLFTVYLLNVNPLCLMFLTVNEYLSYLVEKSY